ncbi:cyclic nucleotide-binding domain-containing protein [Saccharothrix syringae]|uniref:cyclic nucleotide-binding domain-containing protein n=1 Tax=Saccharothrix syringae TaxID=103733 RepID=UPI00068CB01B|nr:cyclic nucleotide-binding domain-containing protein [Saccharothrix syringae]
MIGERPHRGLLGRLSERAVNALLDSGGEAAYEPGQVLLRTGDDGTHVVLVLTGAVKVQADDELTPALLGVQSAGDLVGEMAVLDGGPRSATVVTCGHVTARLISRRQLQVLLQEHLELLVAVAVSTAERIR